MASAESIPADEALELDEVIDVIKIANPINKERLTKAIKKVRDELLAERGYVIMKVFPNTIRQFKLADIILIRADKEIKYIVTKMEEVRTLAYNFKQLLEKLPDNQFCQVNKSHIINIDYFHSFVTSDAIRISHESKIIESELTVSDNFYANFAQLVGIDDE